MTEKINATEVANQLISYFVPGGVFTNMRESFKSFGLGEHGISIPRANAENYMISIQKLFEFNREVESSYTLTAFESVLVSLIAPHVHGKTVMAQKDVSQFFSHLKAAPLVSHSVLRPIYGIHIRQAKTPVALGPYTIFDSVAHIEDIKKQTTEDTDIAFSGKIPPHLIKVVVSAREVAKATEIADEMFERFESIMRYMIGHHTSKFEVGIINYRGVRRKSSFVFGEDGTCSTSYGRDGTPELIPIDDLYFIEPNMGFDKIWKTLTENSISELKKRLLLAVEWIGQSLNENAPSSAFLKAAIALEILFAYQEKSLVNSSILSQIAENVAILLGNDIGSRQVLEAKVKRLYSMRSSIAHAGKNDVELADVDAIRTIAKNVVVKILTAQSMSKISSVAEMYQLFKTKKYSCSEI